MNVIGDHEGCTCGDHDGGHHGGRLPGGSGEKLVAEALEVVGVVVVVEVDADAVGGCSPGVGWSR